MFDPKLQRYFDLVRRLNRVSLCFGIRTLSNAPLVDLRLQMDFWF
jgi:hypothetical protein